MTLNHINQNRNGNGNGNGKGNGNGSGNGNDIGNQGVYGVTEQRMYSLEDCILYGATSACWLLLSCPVYVCISRVRATVLGKLERLTRMEKAGRAAQKQMRRFSV